MSTDVFGCDVTISKSGDIDAWNATQLGFLAHAAVTPEHLNRSAESDPDFVLPIACRGLFSLLLAKRELVDVARQAERDARAAMQRRDVSAREKAYVEALSAWNSGSPTQAANIFESVLATNPEDALAMKLVQAIRFMLGDATGMRRSIETVLQVMPTSHAAYGYAMGCHAFTLEETGEYNRAERIGRAAVEHTPDDAWGLHAVAHVHDMTNRTTAGIDWLRNREKAWEHCNNFRYHVWWHLALMYLDRGEIDAVFDLYDNAIRADTTDDYRDVSNGASLLSRLELEGHDVGNRWEELADISERRLVDGCNAFADLHYLLALTGAKRDNAATALLSRIQKDASREADEMGHIFAHPGLNAAKGLEAFAEGSYTVAFRNLAAARSDMQTIGGSHAQRDVFDRLTVEAALRGGYFDAAEHFLASRTVQRGGCEDNFTRKRLADLAACRRNLSMPQPVPAE